MPGIEPEAYHMQSERSTAELHPLAEVVSPSATNLTIQIVWGDPVVLSFMRPFLSR